MNMLRRRPFRKIAWLLILGYALMAVAYVVGVAAFFSAGDSYYRFGDIVAPRANDVVLLTFLLVVGGSVGSFLNVVAWRLPNGRSINGHSHCPRCTNRLRARDNVPVLGWLWLDGRCRDCRLPISPRYPIVEAAVAVSFALVGMAELIRWNLPYQVFHAHAGPLFTPTIDHVVLLTLGFHLLGISIAWAVGLIRWDDYALPRGLIWFSGVVLVGGMAAFPPAAVVPWQLSVPPGWPPSPWWIAGGMPASDRGVQIVLRIITALAAAGFLGRVLAKSLCPAADLKLSPLGSPTKRLLDLIAMLCVVAIIVGWQATPGVVLIASTLACGSCASRLGVVIRGERMSLMQSDPLARLAVLLPVGLVFQLVFWRPLSESLLWPSESAPRMVLMAAFLMNLLIPVWLRQTNGRPADVPPMSDVD